MNRRQILDRESRGQKLAGFTAIAALPTAIASQIILNSSGVLVGGVASEQVRSFDAHSGAVLAAGLLSALQFALLVYPLYYLFRAVQARSERVNPAMVGFVFLGPLLLAVQSVVFAFANVSLAGDFVDKAIAGGDVYNLIEDLVDDNSVFQVGQYLGLPATLGLAVALVYVPLNAYRVGLLTRFFGTLGMALGGAQILLAGAPQLAQTAMMIWFAWLGFLILDRTPRGRPPAWDAGEAVPWPRPGEEPATATAAEDSVVEGDATEAFEPTAVDHSGRRERAKKKKRKRRQ